jgi:hypothetical protein
MPTISTREVLPLTNEALDRINEVQAFLDSTIGDPVALDTARVKLSESAASVEDAVIKDVREVFSDNFAALRTQFIQPAALKCANVGEPRLPVAFPTNLDSLIPPIYWVAQELGLGQPKMCIEYLRHDKTQNKIEGLGLDFLTFSYRVKIYFQFSQAGYEDTVRILNLSGTAPDPTAQNVLISSRTITSKASYTTYNTDTWVMLHRAWNGSNEALSEVFECKKGGCTNGHNPDPVYARFATDSVEELDATTIQATEARIRTIVNTMLKNIAVSSARVWDRSRLAKRRPKHAISY